MAALLKVDMGKIRAGLGCFALCCAGSVGAAFGQSTQLGLYDVAGYPYYPVDVQVFGTARSHTQTFTAEPVPRESKARTGFTASAKAHRPQVMLDYRPQVSRQRASFGPMPIPGATIMDPWAIGVFR